MPLTVHWHIQSHLKNIQSTYNIYSMIHTLFCNTTELNRHNIINTFFNSGLVLLDNQVKKQQVISQNPLLKKD